MTSSPVFLNASAKRVSKVRELSAHDLCKCQLTNGTLVRQQDQKMLLQ